jgi:hypothetical protein
MLRPALLLAYRATGNVITACWLIYQRGWVWGYASGNLVFQIAAGILMCFIKSGLVKSRLVFSICLEAGL